VLERYRHPEQRCAEQVRRIRLPRESETAATGA
jgi:hypothetical protein